MALRKYIIERDIPAKEQGSYIRIPTPLVKGGDVACGHRSESLHGLGSVPA